MNVLGREIGIATLGSIGAAAVIAIGGAILAYVRGWLVAFTSWLMSPTSVPVWLLLLLAVALIVSLAMQGLQWWFKRSSPLTADEQKIMDVLAQMHPRRPSAAQLARAINASPVLTGAAISSLNSQGYISFPLDLYAETTYYLTGEGLQYIAQRRGQ